MLRYWSGLSEPEIASTLGISRGSVKSTASRAVDALEKSLPHPEKGPDDHRRRPPHRRAGRAGRPASGPSTCRSVAPPASPRSIRPLLYGLAAAACAALIALPFVWCRAASEDSPSPRRRRRPPDPSPSPTVDVPGGGWPQVATSNEPTTSTATACPTRSSPALARARTSRQDPWRVEARPVLGQRRRHPDARRRLGGRAPGPRRPRRRRRRRDLRLQRRRSSRRSACWTSRTAPWWSAMSPPTRGSPRNPTTASGCVDGGSRTASSTPPERRGRLRARHQRTAPAARRGRLALDTGRRGPGRRRGRQPRCLDQSVQEHPYPC